jgi:hypothetical protein
MLVLRVLVTGLVAALGTVALFDGRIVIGVLLIALACARAAMIVERRRRRAELVRRFPGMADRSPG